MNLNEFYVNMDTILSESHCQTFHFREKVHNFFSSITLLIFPSESMMQIKEKMENHILLLLSTMFLIVMSILKTGFLSQRKFAASLLKQSLFECVLLLIIILIST